MASHSRKACKRNVDGELVAPSARKSGMKMDKPICLIENIMDREGTKLVVNPKAINVLSKIHQPAVVVSIVGLYRTGKSYLMNRLAGAQEGFSLGSTIQAETKGIWMWCVPHPTLEDHVLVLLDTEGLGDIVKGDIQNDSKIFTLAVLLSSALVYNSMGTINQDALDKLKHVGEIAELIKVKSGSNENKEANYSTYFPIFIWAVRDFFLELKMDEKKCSADGYLEHALKLRTPEMPADKPYNDLRKQLRMYFGKRKCFVFERPTDSDRELRQLERLPDERLEKRFVHQTNRFCDYIYKNAKVKTVDITINVTGQRLGELAKLYTEALNSSQVACLEEVAVSLAEKENKIAIQEATKHYEDTMRKIPLPTKDLQQFLNMNKRCEDEAQQIFMKKMIRDTDQKFFHEFWENLKRIGFEFSHENEAKSRKKCEGLIKKHSKDFEKALAEGTFYKAGGHGKYQKAINTIKQNYNREGGKGVKAEEVLQEYMTAKQAAEILIIQEDHALSLEEKEEEAENARKQVEEMNARIQQLKEEHENQKSREMANNQKTIQHLVEKLKYERRLRDERLDEVIKEKERERDLYRKQRSNEQARLYQQQIQAIEDQKGFFTIVGENIDRAVSWVRSWF